MHIKQFRIALFNSKNNQSGFIKNKKNYYFHNKWIWVLNAEALQVKQNNVSINNGVLQISGHHVLFWSKTDWMIALKLAWNNFFL